MPAYSRLAGYGLALILIISQALFALHVADLDVHTSDTQCLICLHASSLGHAACEQGQISAPVAFSTDRPTPETFLTSHPRYRGFHSRAPPHPLL